MSYEQTDRDVDDIIRRHQEPPDEPHPRYEDEPEEDELDEWDGPDDAA